ncbi:hypothetical protein LTR37_012584 [Vermiconidia calcicola]|uniref:Uncharacterized protein n=1 Tax=Vermiconidia calcicola TaxID=1690605 RepID=A0ACC3N096_9PEZI|nr:hypothetical protein LTR37_012584 [Vermiconidia calcicola]
MAIIDDLPGVRVEIMVDGNVLKEYEDHDLEEDERTITRYVEAVSGQVFAVAVTLPPDCQFKGDFIVFRIHTDGKRVDAWCCHESSTRSRYVMSDGRMKPDEDTKVKELGTLEVQVLHRLKGPKYRSAPRHAPTSSGEFVSEKAFEDQAISHSIGYVGAAPSETSAAMTTVWRRKNSRVPGEPKPAATFKFCYRSNAALREMLIIPRTPTPPPLEELDVEAMSQDQLKEMQRQLQGVQTSMIKVKREATDDSPRPRKKVRPGRGDTQLEFAEDGKVREASTDTLEAAGREVIELD